MKSKIKKKDFKKMESVIKIFKEEEKSIIKCIKRGGFGPNTKHIPVDKMYNYWFKKLKKKSEVEVEEHFSECLYCRKRLNYYGKYDPQRKEIKSDDDYLEKIEIDIMKMIKEKNKINVLKNTLELLVEEKYPNKKPIIDEILEGLREIEDRELRVPILTDRFMKHDIIKRKRITRRKLSPVIKLTVATAEAMEEMEDIATWKGVDNIFKEISRRHKIDKRLEARFLRQMHKIGKY